MNLISTLVDIAAKSIPFLVSIALLSLCLMAVQRFLLRRWKGNSDKTFHYQMTMLSLSFVCGVALVIALPVSDTLRGQLLSLIGILLSAAIALSSTTFIGNILAGIMLRIIKNARPGDFITISDISGRITEMNLLHVEVQTEDRDLVTIPNVFVVTQPMKVIRASGTIVSAEMSLGYDISHERVSELLREAAGKAGLEDAFVQVLELGDYSIVYRVAGLLTQVSSIISTRSKLREAMLDSLHQAKIEIVSPSFMNTRAYSDNASFIPRSVKQSPAVSKSAEHVTPETLIFDKADVAAMVESVRKKIALVESEIENLDEASETDSTQTRIILDAKREQLLVELEKAKKVEKANDQD